MLFGGGGSQTRVSSWFRCYFKPDGYIVTKIITWWRLLKNCAVCNQAYDAGTDRDRPVNRPAVLKIIGKFTGYHTLGNILRRLAKFGLLLSELFSLY